MTLGENYKQKREEGLRQALGTLAFTVTEASEGTKETGQRGTRQTRRLVSQKPGGDTVTSLTGGHDQGRPRGRQPTELSHHGLGRVAIPPARNYAASAGTGRQPAGPGPPAMAHSAPRPPAQSRALHPVCSTHIPEQGGNKIPTSLLLPDTPPPPPRTLWLIHL